MKTVLVVEDDFDTLHPLSELLRLSGYDSIPVSDVDRALTLAAQRSPDLIITDLVLPGKNGLEFIRALRSTNATRKTPIMVISGCERRLLQEALSAGANLYLEKPINVDKLWGAIDSLVRVKISDDERPQQPEAADNPMADEIDQLVEGIRQSSSPMERETYINQLKQRVLEMRKPPIRTSTNGNIKQAGG